jgi:hypothetical protein
VYVRDVIERTDSARRRTLQELTKAESRPVCRFTASIPGSHNCALFTEESIRSSKQQFSRIRCSAGLGSTNWKPWRNAVLLRTVAKTATRPIRNLKFSCTTSPTGSSTDTVAESPWSLRSSVRPETEPVEGESIVTSTYNLNLKSQRSLRRASSLGIPVGPSPCSRPCFDMGAFSCAEAPSVPATDNLYSENCASVKPENRGSHFDLLVRASISRMISSRLRLRASRSSSCAGFSACRSQDSIACNSATSLDYSRSL